MHIVLEKSKNHQAGANRGPDHSFSVYSNPLRPELCPVTSLGIMVLCTSMVNPTKMLFRPTEQDLFSNWLTDHLKAHAEYLQDATGLPCDENPFGTQSVRKGVISYMLAFPGAASAIACLLRAGYSLGGVLPRYVRQMIAGDQCVGRTLCGLPPQSVDFSLLPARFADPTVVNFRNFVCDLEAYPVSFAGVIPYCVAAVVYHTEWLQKTLPPTHPLFMSRYWRGKYYESLQPLVLGPCRMECPITHMRATGVPQLTAVLQQVTVMSEKSNTHTSVADEVARLGATLVQSISALRTELRAELRATITTSATTTTSTVEQQPLSLNQAVTASFSWPHAGVTLRQIHELWYAGIPAGRVPPLRDIAGSVLAPDLQRYRTCAKGCIDALNVHLPATYHSSVSKDAMFRTACEALVQQLSSCGHKIKCPNKLMGRLVKNEYVSVYTNDLKYIRSYSREHPV